MTLPTLIYETYFSSFTTYEDQLLHPDHFLIFQLAGTPAFAREPQKTKPNEVTLAELCQKKHRKLSLRSSKGGHFHTSEMARSSAISSGGYRRKIAATTASTRCLRRARTIAARAES